eukprot:TRINITY_DN36551_c0_g1_i1.p2 TRINITY_DN36551_c0_g1~~TRINITY_DN36551_c0_g1_i1.p2  ORF type:complete len:109 (-),score=1.89 TRINITY_DN36551_c0_g1_i1:199-525(-)
MVKKISPKRFFVEFFQDYTKFLLSDSTHVSILQRGILYNLEKTPQKIALDLSSSPFSLSISMPITSKLMSFLQCLIKVILNTSHSLHPNRNIYQLFQVDSFFSNCSII